MISGGLGGLGLTIASKLIEAGARHLVLVGRSQPSPETAARLAQLGQRSASVVPFQADISRAAEVERIFAFIRQAMPPLRGVIHAAGSLADGILIQQDWERFASVFGGKLDGARRIAQYMLRQSAQQPLDFFVLFSAGAGWLGSAGQANYAAANTALDGLAHYCRARGLPALSIAWGVWAEVGMAARLSPADQERLRRQGLQTISPQDGAQIFADLLGLTADDSQDKPSTPPAAAWRLSPSLAVMPIESWFAPPRWFIAPPAPAAAASTATNTASPLPTPSPEKAPIADSRRSSPRQQIASAAPNKRRALLMAHVREQALRTLGLKPSYSLDPRQPLREIGLDSLMAVELRNALAGSLQEKLPPTLLFDYPTVEALTDFLAQKLRLQEAHPTPAVIYPTPALPIAQSSDGEGGNPTQAVVSTDPHSPLPTPHSPLPTSHSPASESSDLYSKDLADLSEEEAEALLLQELEQKPSRPRSAPPEAPSDDLYRRDDLYRPTPKKQP